MRADSATLSPTPGPHSLLVGRARGRHRPGLSTGRPQCLPREALRSEGLLLGPQGGAATSHCAQKASLCSPGSRGFWGGGGPGVSDKSCGREISDSLSSHPYSLIKIKKTKKKTTLFDSQWADQAREGQIWPKQSSPEQRHHSLFRGRQSGDSDVETVP